MAMNSITVKVMLPEEMSVWGMMRSKLWPDCLAEDNTQDFAQFVAKTSATKMVFLAFNDQIAIGFAEVSERNYAEGCSNQPVAYLEGWYVEPEFQRRGIGHMLVEKTVNWARAQGYQHLASDTDLHNVMSQSAHMKAGFIETGRAVTFAMNLKS